MSVARYFENFPQINYNNNQAIDITFRVAPVNKILNNPYVFYPYDIAEYERPDQFAYRYYDDPFKSWMLYLTNNVTDPYYSWYLSIDEVTELLRLKYGNNAIGNTIPVNLIEQKIKHYQNNWNTNETLTVSAYNALPLQLKKYWEPVYGNLNQILSYQRKQIDWTVTTNKIVSYTVANSSFVKDEICNIVINSNSVANAQVLAVNGNTVYVHHTIGTVFAQTVNASISYIRGTESTVNTSIISANLVTQNLLPEEEVYWIPVTYYNYEIDKNESNKTIQVLDNRYSKQLKDEFNNILKIAKSQ